MTAAPHPFAEPDAESSYFDVDGSADEVLLPTEAAISGWNAGLIRGPALTAILARAAERVVDQTTFRPIRSTFDLFRPAPMAPSSTRARVVRQGRRLCVVDAEVAQGPTVVARAQTLWLVASDAAPGELWAGGEQLDPPPARSVGSAPRWYRVGDAPWSASPLLEGLGRKQVWVNDLVLVSGERPSGYQLAASAADATNLATHWGSGGIEHINADVTLTAVRRPVAGGIGIAATQRLSVEGISTGTATLFDRDGAFGTSSVTALANATGAVKNLER